MMAQAFISCGQRPGEREIASSVANVVEARGIRPFVAVAAQSIHDVNGGIIAQLKRSDYYIFIDFRREVLGSRDSETLYRGSLFTHQELAIAYALSFENVLFLRQRGVALEGMSAFITANAISFDAPAEVPAIVERELQARRWTTEYSRNLQVANLSWSAANAVIAYNELVGRFLYVDILNRRPDTGAFGAVARLANITDPSGVQFASPVRSHLKVTGHALSYAQTIWPLSHGAVDLLCLGVQQPPRVFLNTSLDVPQSPVITEAGEYLLEYEIFAQDFPLTGFGVKLDLQRNPFSSTASLVRF